jgi:hypothetical protein
MEDHRVSPWHIKAQLALENRHEGLRARGRLHFDVPYMFRLGAVHEYESASHHQVIWLFVSSLASYAMSSYSLPMMFSCASCRNA